MDAVDHANDRRVAALAAIGAFVFLAIGSSWSLPSCKWVVDGWSVGRGALPYRDFWTMYAPGEFFAQALLFRIFGHELWPQALAAVALRAISAALLFLVARRLGAARTVAGFVAAFFALISWQSAPELDGYAPAIALVLFSIERTLSYFENGGARRLIAVGLALGAAAWFKHDVAAYFAIGISVALFAARRSADDGRSLSRLRTVATCSLGALVAIAPLAIFLAVSCGADAWRDLIVFPATDFSAVRHQEWPQLAPDFSNIGAGLGAPLTAKSIEFWMQRVATWAFCRGPELVFVAAAIAFARFQRRFAPVERAIVAIALVSMPLFWLAAHVRQNTHPYSLAVASMLLLVLAWTRLAPNHLALRRVIAAFAIVYAAGLALRPASDALAMASGLMRSEALALDGTGVIRVPHRAAAIYRELVAFVRANTNAGEAIYCGVARHDAVIGNAEELYFLCDRPSATRYAELHPGIADRSDVQREMIADLERENTRCAILWNPHWSDDSLDRVKLARSRISPSFGSELLDDYLREHFSDVKQAGDFTILWRDAAPRPWDAWMPWMLATAPTNRLTSSAR